MDKVSTHPVYQKQFLSLIIHFVLSAMACDGLREELNCPICLDIYADPVMLKCGHIFCHICIRNVLDRQEASGEFSCPECRLQFEHRPLLEKHRKLCNIVEHFMSLPNEQEVLVQGGSSEDVSSKACTPLEKICSFLPRIVEKCSVHEKSLEFYCFNDSQCVCEDCCFSGRHGGHQVELLNEAFVIKREAMRGGLQALTTNRAETRKEVQSLRESLTEVQDNVSGKTNRVTFLFRDIRRQLEHLEKKVLSDISSQGEQNLLLISDLIQQLEVKTEKYSQKMLSIEMAMKVTDPLTFLEAAECPKLSDGHSVENMKKDVTTRPSLVVEDLVNQTLLTGLENIMADAKKMLSLQEQQEVLQNIRAIEEATKSASLCHMPLGQVSANVKPDTEKERLQQRQPQKTDLTSATSEPHLFYSNPYSFFQQ